MAHPTLGYATHVYTRILSHAVNLMKSLPNSRWVTSNFQLWDFGSNAGNFRSILEAALLFHYLSDADPDPDKQRAIVQLMHLYDLTKREKLVGRYSGNPNPERVRSEIIKRLKSTNSFNELPPAVQKRALKGEKLMIEPKEDIIARRGWDKEGYDMFWVLTSQYTHVQSLAFYRMESNGRGTGIENNFDRSMLSFGLATCASILDEINDSLCGHFPSAEEVRQGSASKFSPGPKRNLPKEARRTRSRKNSGIRH